MAKVDPRGRVLYYVNGKPVYANNSDYGFYNPYDSNKLIEKASDKKEGHNRGFHDHNSDLDDDHGHHGPRKGDRGHDPDPHEDHNRTKNDGRDKNDNQKYAKYRLVRGHDGRLNVQYIDVKTGKVLTNKELGNYHIVSAASSLNGIYSQKPHGPDTKKSDTKDDNGGTGTETDPYRKHLDKLTEQMRDSFNDHSMGGVASGFSGANKTSKSASPGGTSANTNTADQGDTNNVSPSYTGPDNNIAAYPGEDTSTSSTDNTGGFHQAFDPSPLSSDWDSSVTTGNMPNGPWEGQNLDSVSVVGDQHPDYDQSAKTDMAKTLAGEMDTRYSDPTSPTGVDEANHIMSTMVNRDETFDGGMSDALHADKAYSTWNNDKAAANAEKNYDKNPGMWNGLVDHFLSDPSLRTPVTNYYNPGLVDPSWSKDLQGKVQIGPHMFGVDPNLSVPSHPLTDSQKNALETNAINNSFMNAPASVQGPQLASSPPEISGPIGTNLGNFPDAVTAQRDYNSTSPANTGGFSDAYAAQRDYDPNSTDNTGVSVSHESFDTSGSNFGIGYNAQRDYNGPSTDDTGISVSSMNTQPGDFSNLGSIDKSGRFSTPGIDAGRFASNPTPTNPGGFYGDMTGGFVSGVTTDPNAAAAPSVAAQAVEAKANDYNSPSGFSTGYRAQDDASTSVASSNPANTVSSSQAISNADSATGGIDSSSTSTPGVSSGVTSTGGDSTSTDTSTSTSTSDTSGTSPGTTGGGLFGGLFGGDSTDTDTSSTGTTGTTSDTNADTSSADVDTGGFADGYF